MRLILAKNKGLVKIELRENSGLLVSRVSSRFNHDKDFEKASATLNIDNEILRLAIDSFEQGGPREINLDQIKRVVNMRSLRESESVQFYADTMLEAFELALNQTDTDLQEPIIYWDDCSELAALDLDAITGHEFDYAQLLSLEGLPIPAYSWVTKSGGLRLIYTCHEQFTAEEVAAVAFLNLRNKPHRSLEIKHDTRHPSYTSSTGSSCGAVARRLQHFEAAHLRRWLHMYSANDEEVEEYLKKNNLQPGQCYEHSFCPTDPHRVSHGKPVSILDKGIHCFSCEAHGVFGGSSKPGFFPYAFLCGSSASTLVYRCMENAVHWEHAKYIMNSKLQLTGQYAKLVYSAGLLLHGHDRKIISRIFSAGKNFIRMSDRWTNANGEGYIKDIRPILASLPACCLGPKQLPNKPRITEFDQPFDLSQYGYPSVKPIYGMRIWSHYLEDKDISAVIQTRELSEEASAKLRPKYAPSMSHWTMLESYFPGVNREYVKLLVAARGIVEGGISMPPMIFVTGPTGAGKTLSVFLAAAVCGDKNSEVVWSPSVDRTRQAIMDSSGCFVTFNEVLKEAKGSLAAMDFLLNLTPDSTSHYMYIGPMKLGRLPVIVLTDTEISLRIKQDAQLARRLIHVNLNHQVDWEAALKAKGIRHPSEFRIHSEETASICNGIASEVIDEFFKQPSTFFDVAKTLGFKQLSGSDEAAEARDALRKLFSCVCVAPEANSGEVFAPGSGWKVIRRNLETDLQRAWLIVCEENFISSRRCSEVDWQKLTGTLEPVFFDMRVHGNDKIAVRFRNSSGTKFNQELK